MPYQIGLYAANGKTFKMGERVRFQLEGYKLVSNFVVMDDAMGVADFLFGRNFLSEYQGLVDLTSMKIVVRAPVQPVWNHAHNQEGDPTLAVPVALDHDLVLQLFECAVVKAKVVTTDLETLVFRNVVLNAAIADASLQNVDVVFSENCVATVSEKGHFCVSVMNLTSNPQRVRGDKHLGTVVPVFLVYRVVLQQLNDSNPKTEADIDRVDFR